MSAATKFGFGTAAGVAVGIASSTSAPQVTFTPVEAVISPVQGRSTSGVTATVITEALLQAKIGESEARLENRLSDKIGALADQIRDLSVKLSEFKADTSTALGGLNTELSHKAGKWAIISTVGAATIGLLAVVGFATNRFDAGMTATGALVQQANDYDKKLERVSQQMDAIAARGAKNDQPATSNPKPIAGPVHP